MDKSDQEIILDGIALVGPATNRQMSAQIRRAMEQTDPELYVTMARAHPLLFGKDSPQRIALEFPELFPKKP